MVWVIVLVVVAVVLVAILVAIYNRLVRLRNRCENAWAQVDVQLRRRYDLIPNLVEAVKGYAAHERETFEEVTKARTAAQQAQGVQEQAQAENLLTQAIGRLFAVAEAVPAAAGDGELPAAPGAALRDGDEDRRRAPDLQRHRPHVRQRVGDGPDERRRRDLQLRAAGVLRGRGAGRARGATGRLLRTAALAAAVLLALFAPGQAAAKSFTLPAANVEVRVQDDGSLAIDEAITFAFGGPFSGAYRDIPLRDGERISGVSVSENGLRYAPGASAELGSSGAPNTFGTAPIDGGYRIVWHYDAISDLRTFTVSYTLSNLAVAYDDVVDVNLKVWGDEWGQSLGRLTAELTLPAPASGPSWRVWGHPVSVRGDVTREPQQAFLRAVDVPSHQFVELRAVFPRSLLSSTGGTRVRGGDALPGIVAEEASAAAAFERDQERIHDALDHLPRTILILLAAALLPALAVLMGTYWLYGRERKTTYDREYEQEPPSVLEPALVPPLLRQSPTVGSLEFTATLFDLIRRGRYKATPVTTRKDTWGGVRHEDIADLEISMSKDGELTEVEGPVAKVVDDVLAGGTERLSNFRERIEEHRTENSKRFTAFKKGVADIVRERKWFRADGLMPLLAAGIPFAIAGALLLWIGIHRFQSFAPRWQDILFIAFGACLLVNLAVLFVGGRNVRLWRRRSPEAEKEAERWEAFRRYLTDFPRLQDAPPASLELWESYLVYGIAFGIAERVLQGAQLYMPEAMHQASSIYWISPTGDLGSGPSALGIGDLSSGFGSALAPPSSGSGGFGGGFSGGGGLGGGGGGGGAW